LDSGGKLKHGFKANAERLALTYREALNIHACGALCAFKLANHLKINIHSATEFLTKQEDLSILSGGEKGVSEWSALTMDTKSGNKIIIFNPFNSEPRQQSDIMHELAHIICEHKHKRDKLPEINIPFGLREYDPEMENEANCLGSTLLLPKSCLFWARKSNLSIEETAERFNASQEMVKYRRNITGISKLGK
jgi:Zn-dependent peptidase ImmA (M78 family)